MRLTSFKYSQSKTKPRKSSAGKSRGLTSGTVSVDAEKSATTKAGTKSRSCNFVVWEDKALSTSFVNTSKDPVAGAYQKGPAYWEHIHQK
jgi:hypothetical protein